MNTERRARTEWKKNVYGSWHEKAMARTISMLQTCTQGYIFFPDWNNTWTRWEKLLENCSNLARENSDWNSVLKYQTSSQRPISWIWNVGNKWIQCNCLKSRILGVIKWNSRFISRRKIFWYLRVAESENALESVKCGRSYPQPRKPENGWAHFFKWRLNLSDLIFNHPDFKRLDFKHSYFKLLKI